MQLKFEHKGISYQTEALPIDISIPLHFNGPQPNTYGVPAAQSAPYRDGQFVGDVNQGGTCNFETYNFTPHCNGTHTECVGHISSQEVYVHEVLRESFALATVLSISPVEATMTSDSYQPQLNDGDLVIDRASLEAAWAQIENPFSQALVIRTLPNSAEKQARDYMQKEPTFFTNEAMQWIHEQGFMHLLVDMPSVDRLFDEGKLSNHHIFWQVPAGEFQVDLNHPLTAGRTITEMIFVPDTIEDGFYLLEIQLAAFMSDAAPSRPRLYIPRMTRS